MERFFRLGVYHILAVISFSFFPGYFRCMRVLSFLLEFGLIQSFLWWAKVMLFAVGIPKDSIITGSDYLCIERDHRHASMRAYA